MNPPVCNKTIFGRIKVHVVDQPCLPCPSSECQKAGAIEHLERLRQILARQGDVFNRKQPFRFDLGQHALTNHRTVDLPSFDEIGGATEATAKRKGAVSFLRREVYVATR